MPSDSAEKIAVLLMEKADAHDYASGPLGARRYFKGIECRISNPAFAGWNPAGPSNYDNEKGIQVMETDARQQQIKATNQAIKLVTDVDVSTLGRRAELTATLNFEDVVPHLERMQDVFVKLGERRIDILPTQELKKVQGAAASLTALIEKVRGFSVESGNPGEACQGIKNEILGAYDGIVHPLLVPLSFTAVQTTDYASREREAEGHGARLKTEHDNMLVFIEDAKKGAQRALEAVQEQAAQAGVSTNAQVFNKEAEDRSNSAASWMTATIWLTSITGVAALGGLMLAFYWTPGSPAEAIHFVASKLILLSALTVATVWCARNYRSHKHNETLNRHRAHALMTFKAFVEGTSDVHVKDAVLVEAAQAAFTGRTTGYESAGSSQLPGGRTNSDSLRSAVARISPSVAPESS